MRRWLSIFLLLLLPLQFTWAAAATYCQHEREVDTQHFGHHQHEHAADADDNGDPSKIGKLAGFSDVDCSSCHLGSAKPVTSLLSVPPVKVEPVWIAGLPDRHGLHRAGRIERPKWHRA